MKSRPYRIGFLVLVVACILLYTGHTLYLVFNHLRLDKTVPIESIEWSVVSLSDEDFVPRATFRYTVDRRSYEKEELWNKHYLNAWAADEAIARLKQETFSVRIDRTDPNRARMQDAFPYKESFSAVFLWMLGLYFYCLNLYLNRFYS